MRNKLDDVSQKLKEVHRLLLVKERKETEKRLDKAISPLEFFQMLTTDPNYIWLRPYTSLLAAIDAFVDKAEVVSASDTKKFRAQITELFSPRYMQHLDTDPEFLALHLKLNQALERI